MSIQAVRDFWAKLDGAAGKGELSESDLSDVVGGAGTAEALRTSSSRVMMSLSALKPGGAVAL
jgi:hypothetical protein